MPSTPLDSRTQVARDSPPKPFPSLVERAALGSKDGLRSREWTSQEWTSQEWTSQEWTSQELTSQELTSQELVWWVSTPGPLVGEPLKKRHPSEPLD